jgi:hypothetical protein
MDMKAFKQAVPGAILSALFSAMIILALIWTGTEEQLAEDFTVTIEYDCRVVVMAPGGFPQQVIEECRDKVRFLTEPGKNTPSV